jgi:hypothetical protein
VGLFRRPADATFLVGALAAILSGYLVHRLWTGTFLREGPPWGFGEVVIALAAFTAAMALALAKDTLPLATWPVAKAALCLGVAVALLSALPALSARRPRVALGFLLAALVADLAWNNGPNESTALPPSMYDVLRPDSGNRTLAVVRDRLGPGSLDRVELVGLGFHWPNASLVHRLHHTLGYNPVRLALYSQATGAEDHAAVPDQRRFSTLMPSYRSPLADLLGLRFIAAGVPVEAIDPRLKEGDLQFVAQTPDGFVYANPRALPRALFAHRAVAVDPAALLRDGVWPEVDFRTTVLLPAPVADQARTGAAAEPGSVTIASYRNTEILIDVVNASAGYLVLNDPHHPWWSAEVDGREAPILLANGLFRAVRMEPGSHRVRFVFRPFRGAWREARQRWPILDGIASWLGIGQ